MSTFANGRIEWIDCAKGISILLVTLHHVAQLAGGAGFNVWRLAELNGFFEPVRMPLFFAVSGVFAGSMLTKPWSVVVRSRVALYLWLFAVWTIVRWLFFGLVLPNPINAAEGAAVGDMAWSILRPETGLWFLWSLAIFTVVAKALLPFGAWPTIALAALISLLAMAVSDYDAARGIDGIFRNIAHRNTVLYFVFFYAAVRLPGMITSLDGGPAFRWLCIALLAFALTWGLTRIIPHPLHVATRFASSIFGVASLLLIAQALDKYAPISRILKYVGLNTLPIYVAQVPIIVAILAAFEFAGLKQWGAGIMLLCPVAVALVAVLTLQLRDLLRAAGANWFYNLPIFYRGALQPSG